MNHSLIVAVAALSGISTGAALAGPALLDYPGPGYREQAGFLIEKKDQKTEITFEWYQFSDHQPQALRFSEPDFLQPFSKPIRLFDNKGGGARMDLDQPVPSKQKR